MSDHSIYLAENFADFATTPGFPYLRMHPALQQDDYPIPLSPEEEQVILVMHSTSNELLVISNRNVRVYKIPRYKPFLERLGGAGVKFGLGFVPGVGQALELVDKLGEGRENLETWGKLLGGIGGKVTGKAKKERLAELQRASEGMPTKKELEDVTWDTRKIDTLILILCYRDRILLENGFEWKTTYSASLEKSAKAPNQITIDENAIVFNLNGKSKTVPFLRKKFDTRALTQDVLQKCQQMLTSTGWSIGAGEKKTVLMDVR